MDLDNCWVCVLLCEFVYMCMVCLNLIIFINVVYCYDVKGCMFELVSVYFFNVVYFKFFVFVIIGLCVVCVVIVCGDNLSCFFFFKRFDSLLSFGVFIRFIIFKCGV